MSSPNLLFSSVEQSLLCQGLNLLYRQCADQRAALISSVEITTVHGMSPAEIDVQKQLAILEDPNLSVICAYYDRRCIEINLLSAKMPVLNHITHLSSDAKCE